MKKDEPLTKITRKLYNQQKVTESEITFLV